MTVGEANNSSLVFWAQQAQVYPIYVRVSTAIPGPPTEANVVALLDAAEYLLLKKDSANDYRAIVDFQVSLFGTFNPGNNDPVPDNDDARQAYTDGPADITYVNDLLGGAVGWCYGEDWQRIIIEWAQPAHVTAHEMGHGVGLDTAGGATRVMSDDWGTNNELIESEADAYD